MLLFLKGEVTLCIRVVGPDELSRKRGLVLFAVPQVWMTNVTGNLRHMFQTDSGARYGAPNAVPIIICQLNLPYRLMLFQL